MTIANTVILRDKYAHSESGARLGRPPGCGKHEPK